MICNYNSRILFFIFTYIYINVYIYICIFIIYKDILYKETPEDRSGFIYLHFLQF